MGKDAGGGTVNINLPLAVKPLAKSPQYNLADGDPIFHSDDEDFDAGFTLRREWGDVPLPLKPTKNEATFQYLVEAQQAHNFHASLLAMHSIDVCKVHKMSKSTMVLESISKEDHMCPICQKGLAGAQSLCSHIRTEHVSKTKYYCQECDKYFAKASGLKIHNRKHGVGPMFLCIMCNPSHIPAAERADVKCPTCGKEFVHRQSYRDHVKWCGKEWPCFQCHLCPKNYAHKRDLTGHLKSHEKKPIPK